VPKLYRKCIEAKKRKLANSCPDNVDELMEDIIHSINSIRQSPIKLPGCIVQSELFFFALVSCIINAEQENQRGKSTRPLIR
jgi:hypothetical protein